MKPTSTAGNKSKGEVILEIGGQERKILFDLNAIAMLEGMHGGTPIHVLMSASHFGVSVLRSAIYCAVVAGSPRRARVERLTLEDVGRWLTKDADRMEEIAGAIMDAAQAAMPGAFGDDDEEADAVPPVPAPVAAAAAPAPATRPPVNEEVRVAAHLTSDVPTPTTPAPGSTTTPSGS